VIIGAYGADPNGNNGAGESYVVFGQATGFGASIELSALNGTNGFVINGIDGGDRSGISVSSAGDVNGDGFDDLIVGADSASPNGPSSGESYIIFGAAFGNGVIFGTTGDDIINGTAGADIIRGRDGNDTLIGLDGNDRLEGGGQNDTLTGGAGLDTFVLGNDGSFDTVTDFSLTDDTVDVAGFFAPGVTNSNAFEFVQIVNTGVVLFDSDGAANGIDFTNDGAGSLTGLTVGDSVNVIVDNIGTVATVTVRNNFTGSAAGETISGTAAGDLIQGLAGDDTLNGLAGSDVLLGGVGIDILNGGNGDDILVGGANWRPRRCGTVSPGRRQDAF